MPRLLDRIVRIALVASFAFAAASAASSQNPATQPPPAGPPTIEPTVTVPFRFVAYGDTRFHDPHDIGAANPRARIALVRAIADAHPSFICFTGDIVYTGSDQGDWKIFDSETAAWREKKIQVFPVLGNHEFHGDPAAGLGYYFDHFPELKNSHYYSVRAGNTLVLALDSSADETLGPQGQWLTAQLDNIPSGVDFVFVMLHHPPYTSSSMNLLGEGHAARPRERALAALLEQRQAQSRARFIVFSGHVHNYDRHEHGGVTYFVSGGGGAHAYPIPRAHDDPYQSKEINYHYLLAEVDRGKLKITMHRVEIRHGKEVWTEPDTVEITAPAAAKAAAQSR